MFDSVAPSIFALNPHDPNYSSEDDEAGTRYGAPRAASPWPSPALEALAAFRAAASALLLEYWDSGDVDEAVRALSDADAPELGGAFVKQAVRAACGAARARADARLTRIPPRARVTGEPVT